MRKQLTVLFLALGVFGLLLASVQAQPNPAIVMSDETGLTLLSSNDGIGLIASADIHGLELAACGSTSGEPTDEKLRWHTVETFSENFNESISGPVYVLLYPFGESPCTEHFAMGLADFSMTSKNHGKNTFRITIGGFLETFTSICPSGVLDFNFVINQQGTKGPRYECVEAD